MRLSALIIVVMLIMLLFSCYSTPAVSGFTIVEPKNGSTFHPGDTITLRAMAAPDEKPALVFLRAIKMTTQSRLMSEMPYGLTFTIPTTFTGKDTLAATAKFADGTIIEKEVQIQVVLPSNVVLTGISASPTYILFQKMPPGSDPIKVSAYETESVAVGGIYSDGVKREITAATSGTTYNSSDEKVVTVSPEGDIAAQGLGTATITVRNGKYSATVKVVVKPYKK